MAGATQSKAFGKQTAGNNFLPFDVVHLLVVKGVSKRSLRRASAEAKKPHGASKANAKRFWPHGQRSNYIEDLFPATFFDAPPSVVPLAAVEGASQNKKPPCICLTCRADLFTKIAKTQGDMPLSLSTKQRRGELDVS